MCVEKHKMSSSQDKGGTVLHTGQWSDAAQILSKVKTWHIEIDS